jgi:hypothetical protein
VAGRARLSIDDAGDKGRRSKENAMEAGTKVRFLSDGGFGWSPPYTPKNCFGIVQPNGKVKIYSRETGKYVVAIAGAFDSWTFYDYEIALESNKPVSFFVRLLKVFRRGG